MSASSSLNAAIAMKKEAEKKRLEAEEAERQAKIAANKPVVVPPPLLLPHSLIHAWAWGFSQVEEKKEGWWATTETGQMNLDADTKAAPKAAFTSQFGLTGQGGIGSSLFNIRE